LGTEIRKGREEAQKGKCKEEGKGVLSCVRVRTSWPPWGWGGGGGGGPRRGGKLPTRGLLGGGFPTRELGLNFGTLRASGKLGFGGGALFGERHHHFPGRRRA